MLSFLLAEKLTHFCLQDYPEHRLQFFALLRAITNACPSTLFAMSPSQLKLVIDSIVWAFRHTERNVADTGLNLLLEMLAIFDKNEMATQFYRTYYLNLVRELFAVMTGDPHWNKHAGNLKTRHFSWPNQSRV